MAGGAWMTQARTPPAAGRGRRRMPPSGLRIVLEILQAVERARQNGGPEHYVDEREMEGMKLAALALTNYAIVRVQPE